MKNIILTLALAAMMVAMNGCKDNGTTNNLSMKPEKQERELLFKIPEGENDPAEMKKTKGCGWIYMIFAVAVFAFFWFMWAVPYLNA